MCLQSLRTPVSNLWLRVATMHSVGACKAWWLQISNFRSDMPGRDQYVGDRHRGIGPLAEKLLMPVRLASWPISPASIARIEQAERSRRGVMIRDYSSTARGLYSRYCFQAAMVGKHTLLPWTASFKFNGQPPTMLISDFLMLKQVNEETSSFWCRIRGAIRVARTVPLKLGVPG